MCRGKHLQALAEQEREQDQEPSSPPSPTPSNQAYLRDWRRRSADVGGLQRALAAGGGPAIDFNSNSDPAADRESWDQDQTTLGAAQGQGWMGGDPGEFETLFAELVSDMHTQSVISVNDNSLEFPPTAISHSRRTRLIHLAEKWHFEPHILDEDDVLACTLILFEALFRVEGMQEAIPVTMHQISTFIHHLRKIYRLENSYHNFAHALDVLHATQSYLRSAGAVPPPSFLIREPEERRWSPIKSFNSGSLIATLGLKELFVLYIAAIGHDVGHPGFNNHFMKNAQSPLAQLYPFSALEQMHCQLLFLVMRQHGLGFVLDDRHLRKVLQQSVLATDMSVHDDFMETLRNVVEGGKGALCQRQVVMCQAILKNADISNPTRPFLVSKHWASALMDEWFAQAHLEQTYQLVQTVKPSSDPIDEASSQIFFITRFARPLLELTEKAVPEMSFYVGKCKGNLKEWTRKRKEMLEAREREAREREAKAKARRGKTSMSVPSTPATRAVVPASLRTTTTTTKPISNAWPMVGYHNAFPLTLPVHPPPLSFSFSSSPSSPTSTSSAENTPSFSQSQSQSRTHSHHNSSSSTNGREQQDDGASAPDSPSPSAFASDDAESVFSPLSETSGSGSGSGSGSQVHLNLSLHRYPSISSNASSTVPASLRSNSNSSTAAGAGAGAGAGASVAQTPHAAIRAASKVGSMRKKSRTDLSLFGYGEEGTMSGGGGGGGRKGARNSWSASTSLNFGFGAGLGGLFQAQPPGAGGNGNGNGNGTTTTTNGAGSNGGHGNGNSSSPNPPPASAPPNGVKTTSAVSSSPIRSAAAFMRPIKLQVSP